MPQYPLCSSQPQGCFEMRTPIPLAPGSTELLCLGTSIEPSQAGKEAQAGLGCTGVRMLSLCPDGEPTMPQMQPHYSHLSRLRGSRPCFHHQPWHTYTAGRMAELYVEHVPTHPSRTVTCLPIWSLLCRLHLQCFYECFLAGLKSTREPGLLNFTKIWHRRLSAT